MRPDQLESRLRDRLEALGPAPRAEREVVIIQAGFDKGDSLTTESGAGWSTIS